MTTQRTDSRGMGRPRPKKWDGARYAPRRKVCAFCADKNVLIDYKDAVRLRHFISDRGKIDPRRRTGTCARHQRELTIAIKRARHLALIPYVAAHIREMGVPMGGAPMGAPPAPPVAHSAGAPPAPPAAPPAPAASAPPAAPAAEQPPKPS